ncbi:putative glutathione S-transferase [Aliiruegeria haliotis]|uniref:Putative glutathione S-transferase n=1 Tax=Aliiruegeria haliotis TaxID=1280846 RepID=A0A2T0RIY7_9RHOB|nr:glutathione S-transferase family protein [Aliiruegeria haliotis]PRY21153.1 putative glutathione S-transferase [Aliiruegeria haliotis]
MGLLVNGKWQDTWYDTKSTGGKFVRSDAGFRNWITRDGSPGPSGKGGFKAESGRYHLYVAYACPWAHRTLIYRSLKGLDEHISVSVVHPDMLDNGWSFATDYPGTTGDTLFGAPFLHTIYTRAVPDITTRVTVPVLWDKESEQIVSNESSEIIRMFDEAFTEVTGLSPSLRPAGLRDQIDDVNARLYPGLNNGVYRAGFATSQSAYDEAVAEVFDTLDWMERRLGAQRYLAGDVATEADWRAFTTLIRFDPVYHAHFKCSRNRIADMPNLSGYLRELYQWPGIAQTVNFDHIRRHYFHSHETINPTRIVPMAPMMDLKAPHGRGHASSMAAE